MTVSAAATTEMNGRMIQCKGFGSRAAWGEGVGEAPPGDSKMNM